MKRRGLGYQPDLKDPQDYGLAGLSNLGAAVDLRPFVKKVLDQGNTNSCVLNAIASSLAIRGVSRGRPWSLISRLYGYYFACVKLGPFGLAPDGKTLLDDGCRPRDALHAIYKLGSPPEHEWPFDLEHLHKRPPHLLRRNAVDQAFTYRRCDSVALIRGALARGYPVVLGLNIDEAFTEAAGPSFVTSFSPDRIGGHMMTIVGDDPEKRRLLLLNSWGEGWRDGGFAWVSYELIATEMQDAWAIL